MVVKKLFDMKKQSLKQYLSYHESAIKLFFSEKEIQLLSLKNVSSQYTPLQDFIFIVGKNNKKIQGIIESKTDIFTTQYMVSELLSYVCPSLIEQQDVEKFKKRIYPNSENYSFLFDFVKKHQNNQNNFHIKRGLGFATNEEIGRLHIFSYLKIREKKCYFWRSKIIRDRTMCHFNNQDRLLILTESTREGRLWYTISLLLKYDELIDDKCLISLINIK